MVQTDIFATLSIDDESFSEIAMPDATDGAANETNIDVTVTPKSSTIGTEASQRTTQICVTMRAPKLPSDVDRQPVDILVALDLSDSMNEGNKLALCKSTLELLLRHMIPEDRFGLITYSYEASVAVPMQFMTSSAKDSTLSKIKSLKTNGNTNISAAVALAFQELRAVNEPNHVRSVFLLTDGHANVGLTRQQDLVELTRNCWLDSSNTSAGLADDMEMKPKAAPRFKSFFSRKRDPPEGNTFKSSDASETSTLTDEGISPPISMFCFGYGTDHNSELLREMTDATETGSYYFVKDDCDVGSAFGSAMGGILSMVGQSAVLTLAPGKAEGVQIKAVHHPSAIQRDDGTYTVSVGDFYAEETRDVVVEVTLAEAASSPSQVVPHLVVSLAYTNILRKVPVRGESVVCSISRPASAHVSPQNEHVTAQWLRVLAAQKMTEADQLANQNKLQEAQQCLQFAYDVIFEQAEDVQSNGMIAILAQDLEASKSTLQTRQAYASEGRHRLAYKSQMYRKQRCSESAAVTSSAFRCDAKDQMQKAFDLSEK